MQLYDKHIRLENLTGRKYLPRAVLRFCYQHVDVLSQPDMPAALNVMLTRFVICHDISKEVKNECLKLIQAEHMARQLRDASGPTTQRTADAGIKDETRGRTTSTSNGSCACGKVCTTARGIIYCANRQCSRREFHLQCVGLARRRPDWRCSSCRQAAVVPKAPVAVM